MMFFLGKLNRTQKQFKLIKAIHPVIVDRIAICRELVLFVPITQGKRAYTKIVCRFFNCEIFPFHDCYMLCYYRKCTQLHCILQYNYL